MSSRTRIALHAVRTERTGPGRLIAGGEKRKDKRFDIVLETKPKRFGIVPVFVLFENRLFRFGPESTLLYQIKMISFRWGSFGNELTRYGFIPGCRNVCGTFVERLWNVCSLSVLTLRHSAVEKKRITVPYSVH